MSETLVHLRTAAWYGDLPLDLTFPERWEVEVYSPATGAPWSDSEIRHALKHPVGQAPIAELARGKTRPVVVVDDLTRPTPVDRILPILLEELSAAGIGPESVTVVMATGAHGPARASSVAKKVGETAARRCRLLSHDHRRNTVSLGRTAFGTPIHVNRHVAESDLVIGIGGLYPQGREWLGGGTKLALGVLGGASIFFLHQEHRIVGPYAVDNPFRRDLDEIARKIGLGTVVTVHVNADREVVRVSAGDPVALYPDAADYSRRAYSVPGPGDADVVISNAYPMDVSLTFARSKGMTPLLAAKPGAVRVLVAACAEGPGLHPFFPMAGTAKWERRTALVRHMVRARPRTLPRLLARAAMARLPKLLQRGARVQRTATSPGRPPGPVLYQPPPFVMTARDRYGFGPNMSWEEVVAQIEAHHPGGGPIRAVLYPCAPLQLLADD